MAAARAWWMIRAVGHDRVALLDGGWRAAVAADLPLESLALESTMPAPATEPADYPLPRSGGWTLPTADVEEVETRRLSRDSVVILVTYEKAKQINWAEGGLNEEDV